MTGDRTGAYEGAGWEFVHLAIDDHCLRRLRWQVAILALSQLPQGQQAKLKDVLGMVASYPEGIGKLGKLVQDQRQT